jgi:hypothetical protein
MTPTLQSFCEALQSQDVAQIMSVFHTNTTKLLGNKCGPASSDLWSYCIGEVFVLVQIETKLHKLFRSGSFAAFQHFRYCTTGRQSHMWQNIQLLLQNEGEMFPPSHVAFVRNTWQQSKNVAACWIWVLSRCARRLSCASWSVAVLVCIPCSVLLCALHSLCQRRVLRHRNTYVPCLGYQKYSQAAVLLAACRCAAQTGAPPLNFHRR